MFHSSSPFKWTGTMNSFFTETLNFLFRKFWATSVLDFEQTVWTLQIFSQKFSLSFWMKELWALENHVLMLMWICYFAPVIPQRYIKYTLAHSSKRLAYLFIFVFFRRSFKTAMFSRFLKVAITTSNVMNEVYNGRFSPELSDSMLKKIIVLVWDYL